MRWIALFALSCTCWAACAYDWDQFDPRLTGAGGSGAAAAQGGDAGAPVGGAGGTGADGGAGGGGDGARRRLLTLAPTNETFFDFPLLVVLDASRIDYAATQDAGQDLRFLAADETTVLSHEIELWDESATSFVWVKVPSYLSGTMIWMYYGDPNAADGQNAVDVWSNDYVAVWHMNGALLDSSGHGSHGLVTGTVDAPAMIGHGQLFAEVGDHIDVAASIPLTGVFAQGGTMEALIFPNTSGLGGVNGRIVDKSLNVDSNGGWTLEINGTLFSFEVGFTTGSSDWESAASTVSFGAWQLMGVVYTNNAPAPALFKDGATLTTSPFSTGTGSPDVDAATALAIGNRPVANDRTFDGIIDEVRLATVARSAGWMAAQYASMTDALVTYGREESAP